MSVRILAKVSGGEGSFLAADEYQRRTGQRVELLFTDTLIEDQDTYRFLIAGAAYLRGVALPAGFLPEITDFPPWEDRAAYKAFVLTLSARTLDLIPGFHWIADGRDPFDVYEHERFLGNSSADPCSKILKRQLSDRWLRENCDPAETAVLVGIDDTERLRFEGNGEAIEALRARAVPEEKLPKLIRGLRAQMAEAGWDFRAPLIDWPLMPWDIRPRISAAGLWQQRLSVMGFSHSNCGGHCCKGGQAHWKLMLRCFPERYAYVEQREREIRAVLGDVSMMTDRRKRPGDTATVKRTLTLADLRSRTLTVEEAAEVSRCSCFSGDELAADDPLQSTTATKA